jgi:beta-N-acetylhexosaminidase
MTAQPLSTGTVGELFMLGFRGTRVPAWLRGFSQRFGLGGVILFDYDVKTKVYDRNVRSPSQVAELCAELADLPSPPLIYVDQEGGRVRRLKEKLGFAPLPSAQEFATLSRDQARAFARTSFAELVRLGIHVNLAPVVDLNLNPDNPDIGVHGRAYSDIPEVVRANALLVNQAAREAGLGLCLKHFPGIGGSTVNSHDAVMDLGAMLRTEQLDLFFELGRLMQARAVLVSHGFVPPWDAERPACLSPAAIGRLRAKLPDALLISDDLQMQGLQRRFTTAQALPLAVQAGVDVLLLGNNLLDEEEQAETLAIALEGAIARDENMAAHARASLARIAARKAEFIGMRQRYGHRQSPMAQRA